MSSSAGTDVAVQSVTVDDHPRFGKGDLPGEHMRVDGVYQRAIQIEDQRVQGSHSRGRRM